MRLDLAEDGAERSDARDQGAHVRGRAGGRGAHAQRHRQALPHTAQRVHRRLGRPPGAPAPLPAPLQAILWWGQGRTRVERVRAKEFLTYPVGQIVADLREETSVRRVVQDMLAELADSKQRLDRLLG